MPRPHSSGARLERELDLPRSVGVAHKAAETDDLLSAAQADSEKAEALTGEHPRATVDHVLDLRPGYRLAVPQVAAH